MTPESIRLGLTGLAAASVTGVTWRVLGLRKWGMAPFVLAVLAAAELTGRSDRPRSEALVAAGTLATVLAGVGAARLLAHPATHWGWVAIGALISAGGVWSGVPETGPAVLVGGSIAGLGVSAALTRSRWGPAAGIGAAVVLGWAALSGAVDRPGAALGGALCTGLAPWFAFRPLLPTLVWSRRPGPWLLGGHFALVALAARWIAVDPRAGWQRLAVLGAAGLAVAAGTRLRA